MPGDGQVTCHDWVAGDEWMTCDDWTISYDRVFLCAGGWGACSSQCVVYGSLCQIDVRHSIEYDMYNIYYIYNIYIYII